jgi:hypothetical protein
MSCANSDINTVLKDITKKSLNYISNYTTNINKNILSNLYNYNNDINNPFTTDFKNKYSSNIQTDLNSDNSDGLSYITTNIDDNVYVNCAVQTSVPWFTINSNYNKCEIVNNIDYDVNRLNINNINDKSVITPVLVSKDKTKSGFCAYYSNVNKSYCENRWYDWIITPNYYLGNTYYKDNSHYTELDVYKCYKPCSDDYLPYTTPSGEIKCIPKKYFTNGIFSNKYMFNSIGLINLIGNIVCNIQTDKNNYNTNLLYILHRLIYEYDMENKIDGRIYKIDSNIDNIIKLKSTQPDTPQTIFNSIKSEYDIIYNELKKTIDDVILKNFINSNNKDYKYINEFTYANNKFNENEPEMYSYTGMEANGLLTDPILIHTWMLSQLFKPLDTKVVFETYLDTNYASTVVSDEKTTNENRKTNLDKIQEQFIYKKLLKIVDDKHKAIRLKNIFFKAINNCYNNKSNFSINLISITKKALQNATLKNIIIDNKFYKFDYNINFLPQTPQSAVITTINAENTVKNIYERLFNPETIITDHLFYKDTDIITLYDRYKALALAKNTNSLRLEYFNNGPPAYCHYLFSAEELEIKTCPVGQIYNTYIQECEVISEKKVIVEKKSNEDDDFGIPDLKNIFTIFIQILMVILIIYIFYIIYDIFGEMIKHAFNYIIVSMISAYNYIYLNTAISGEGEYEKEQKRLEYIIKMTENELKTIQSKKDTIKDYKMKNG